MSSGGLKSCRVYFKKLADCSSARTTTLKSTCKFLRKAEINSWSPLNVSFFFLRGKILFTGALFPFSNQEIVTFKDKRKSFNYSDSCISYKNPGGGGVQTNMAFTGMCCWSGYDFLPLFTKQGIQFRVRLSTGYCLYD